MPVSDVQIADLVQAPILEGRAQLNEDRVAFYMEHIDDTEPVTVFKAEGRLLLADGYHRLAAAQRLGRATIRAEVREGEASDALEFAVEHAIQQRGVARHEAMEAIFRRSRLAGNITVRPAVYADLTAVAHIFAYYVLNTTASLEERPPASDYFEDKLDDLTARGLPFLVAELSGEVVGYAYAAPWRPKTGYRFSVEDTIYVARHATGRGVGTALLSALVSAAAHAGMRQMIAVITESDNSSSAMLHRRFGFSEAGRLVAVGYKHGRWIDTFLLQRSLSQLQAEEPSGSSRRESGADGQGPAPAP